MIKDYSHPSIFIYCSLGINEMDIEEILWGIEEEGIPFTIKCREFENSNKLSHLAAIDSKLSVGIGIDNKGNISLTIDKLNEETPLFNLKLKDNFNLRNLGANGARLVKGMPLKNIN